MNSHPIDMSGAVPETAEHTSRRWTEQPTSLERGRINTSCRSVRLPGNFEVKKPGEFVSSFRLCAGIRALLLLEGFGEVVVHSQRALEICD